MMIASNKLTNIAKSKIYHMHTNALVHREYDKVATSKLGLTATITALHLKQFHADVLDVVQNFLTPRKCRTSYRSPSLRKIYSETSSLTVDFCPSLTGDAWRFHALWPYIQELCITHENLYKELRLRRVEIHAIREHMRASIPEIPGLAIALATGNMSLIPLGISGSYILTNKDGVGLFVIKPLDEDIGAINNPKGYASPFTESPIRQGIPLYRSSYREVAAYKIAELLDVASIIPRTAFGIVESDQFFDLSQAVSPKEMQRFADLLGAGSKEKLCSVQEFVVESKVLFEAMQDLQAAGLLDEEIEHFIDQTDFEEANILLWVTGDTDGHMGNFLVTPKTVDEIGNQVFGLRKIDNGLAFPEVNGQLINCLSHLPNACRSLSAAALKKIEKIDSDSIAKTLTQHSLGDSCPAMRERIELLQKITKENPTLSIYAINKKITQSCNIL